MLKVRLNKPKKISKKVLKRRNNHSKKQHYHKNQQLSKPSKNYNNGLEQMQKVRHKMQSNTLNKELKMQSKVQRKQQVMKDLSFNKPNKTSLRDGRAQRKVLKMYMIRQQRS